MTRAELRRWAFATRRAVREEHCTGATIDRDALEAVCALLSPLRPNEIEVALDGKTDTTHVESFAAGYRAGVLRLGAGS